MSRSHLKGASLTIAVLVGAGAFYISQQQELRFDPSTLPPTAAGAADTYDYLDDAPTHVSAYTMGGNYPKVVATETQALPSDPEQFSKYDVISTDAGMLHFAERVQAINPSVKFHFAFSPRAYQGFTATSDDMCMPGRGMIFSGTGPATEDCKFFAGHWMYYAGTKLSEPLKAGVAMAYVDDASKLAVGQYVVIYDAPAGTFRNAEHALVTAIDTSTSPHRVTLDQRGFKSSESTHGTGSIIAQHVLGQGATNQNWAYNTSTVGPRDANGRLVSEVMLKWLDETFGIKSTGDATVTDITGYLFDADGHFFAKNNIDANNDLVADGGMSPSGINWWGEGLDYFYSMMREKFPNLTLVGGMNTTRGFKHLNGVQMEGWPVTGEYESATPEYGHVLSTAVDGFDSNLQKYMIHLNHHEMGDNYMENLAKTPTKLYPGKFTGLESNAPFRFAFASTLLGDGLFGYQNSKEDPDQWYDEYAVDVVPSSPTYGHAIASNPSDESAIRAHKGWLGEPLGSYERLYDGAAFAPEMSLISNGDFESGPSGWGGQNIRGRLDTLTAAAGTVSVRIGGHRSFTNAVGEVVVASPLVTLEAGKEYTLAFSAKAKNLREISVRVQGPRSSFLVPTEWTRMVHTFKAETSGNAKARFLLGRENSPIWLDEVYLFEGNANVFMREFDNGIVVVNATPSSQTVDLGDTYLRIKGTGQDAVNDGSEVQVVTLDAYDAAILVRPDNPEAPISQPAEPTPPVEETPVEQDLTCGTPAMDDDDEVRVYLWEDTCNPGNWRLEANSYAGLQTLIGKFQSSDAFTSYAGSRLESSDVVESNLPTEISFNLIISVGVDAIDFKPASGANTCLSIEGDFYQLRLGSDARPVSGSIDIDSGEACTLLD